MDTASATIPYFSSSCRPFQIVSRFLEVYAEEVAPYLRSRLAISISITSPTD